MGVEANDEIRFDEDVKMSNLDNELAQEYLAEGSRKSAMQYLTKPIDLAKLLTHMKSYQLVQ
jgi:hypothetical protein